MKKTKTFLFIAVVIFSFTQCSNPTSESILQNAEKRGEIISVLLNNQDYTFQLMDSMMLNNHTIMMMYQNKDFMHKMMYDSSLKNMMMTNMMYMMVNDSLSGSNMTDMIMNNDRMRSMMQGKIGEMKGKNMMKK